MQWPEYQDSLNLVTSKRIEEPAKLELPSEAWGSWGWLLQLESEQNFCRYFRVGQRKWLSHCFASGGRDMASLDISALLCALWAILGVGVM